MTSSPLESTSQSTTWSVLLDGPQSGPFNMALDETLLDGVSRPQARPQTYLRFYQWIRPTLSLGISQNAERVVDFDYCHVHGIDVVRRPTGGKAVLHHRELTYSVISNDPAFFPMADISGTYCRIANALQSGFHFLGIETTLALARGRNAAAGPLSAACFAVSNHHEVLWQNRKLAGSAQRRTKNAFLQHGSIMIEFDAEPLSKALRSCDIASVNSAVTDLKTCLGSIPPMRDLIAAMSRGFEAVFEAHLVNSELSQELSARAHDLADQRCSVLNWSDQQRQRSGSVEDSAAFGAKTLPPHRWQSVHYDQPPEALSLNSEVEVRDTALNNAGQAFQPAGSPDFPVRAGATGKSPQLADKNVCPTQAACSIAGQLRNSG